MNVTAALVLALYCQNHSAGIPTHAAFTETPAWKLKTTISEVKLAMSGIMIAPMIMITSSIIISKSNIEQFKIYTNTEAAIENGIFVLSSGTAIIEYMNQYRHGCIADKWNIANRVFFVAYYCTIIFKLCIASIMQLHFLRNHLSCKYPTWLIYLIAIILAATWISMNVFNFDQEVLLFFGYWGLSVPYSMTLVSGVVTGYAIYKMRQDNNQAAVRRYKEYGYYQLSQYIRYALLGIFQIVVTNLNAENKVFGLYLAFQIFNCVLTGWPVLDLLALYNVTAADEPLSILAPFKKSIRMILYEDYPLLSTKNWNIQEEEIFVCA